MSLQILLFRDYLYHGSSGNNLVISKYLLFCSKTFAYFGNKRS